MRGRQNWWRWAVVIAALAGALYGRARLRAVAGLGRIECALYTPDRFFQRRLADTYPCGLGTFYLRPSDDAVFAYCDATPATALVLPASASAENGRGETNVRLIGVHWITPVYEDETGEGRHNRYSDLWTWSDDDW